MSTKNIFSAIKTVLSSFTYGVDMVFPNVNYTPNIGTPFCQIAFLPGTPEAAELGRRKTEIVTGVTQLDLYFPVEQGDGDLLTVVDLLKYAFGRGDSIQYGESCARIESAYPSGAPTVEGVWFRQVFDISWSAYEFVGENSAYEIMLSGYGLTLDDVIDRVETYSNEDVLVLNE